MTAAVEELKVRARVRRNALRKEGGEGRLRDMLHEVAREVGFTNWEHARRVLGGDAAPGEDMGTFWHAPATTTLLNEWFAEAGAARVRRQAGFLLPYRRQVVVVQEAFIRELHLDPQDAAWAAIDRDLVAGYGTPAWAALCARRVRAPRPSFAGR